MTIPPEALSLTHAAAFTEARPWGADEFRSLLQQQNVFLIGTGRCFVLARLVADEAEILTLATHPDHRRRGLARQALHDLEQRLTGQARIIFLEVDSQNAAARALYASCGFAQTGQRRAYYRHLDGTVTDALILARKLT